MLRESVVLVVLAGLVARSGLPVWLRDSVVAPPLPVSYASLGSERPVTSSRVDAATNLWAPSPLKFCEDATEWDVGGSGRKLVLLSCDAGRREWNTVMGPLKDAAPKAQLWVVDPASDSPAGSPVGLKNFPGSTSDFHPLGIDIFKTHKGDILYVVNHQATRSTIELFALTLAKSKQGRVVATYIATLDHPSFTGAPNALAVISPTAFYLSHDHRFPRRSRGILSALLNRIETLAALPLSRVDLVEISTDPKLNPNVRVSTVATRVAFANGLALSHDRDTLAVASTTHRAVRLYSVNPETHSLQFREQVALPFLVDNLSLAPRAWSAQGDVFIAAGHPHFFSLAAAAGGEKLGPADTHPSSWVVAISPRTTNATGADDLAASYPASMRAVQSARWELTTLFQSNGGQEEGAFGMSSAAVGGVGADGRRWMVVTGLYADGARFLREA